MLAKLVSFFFGAGDVAGAVAGAAKAAGIAAAAPLVWKFIEGHGQDVLFNVNVNQALAAVGVGVLVVAVAHGAKSG